MRATSIVSAASAGLFLVLCCLHLHGFSLPLWHLILDQTPQQEVLLGHAQGVRSDDWATMLPLAFAQDAQSPRFPERSALVGYGGADTLIGHPVPVRSWLMLFRPQVWGYFVGRDFGMSWHWWFRILGLFYASFLFFQLLTEGRTWIALALSVALVFAPFFQFWCFSVEPLLAMALLSFRSVVAIARAPGTRTILLWSLLLAWTSGCFALSVIYPPFQVSLAWFLVFLGTGWLAAERARLRARGRLGARTAAVLSALGVAGTCALAFFVQNRETIRILNATVYPGQRLSSGGDLPVLHMLNSFFTPFLGESWWGVFNNISDSGSFLFFFPLSALLIGWDWMRTGNRPHPVILALAAFWVLACAYALVGVPEPIARITLGGRVPGFRMLPAMGVADLSILALFLAASSARSRTRWVELACAGAWVAALAAVGVAIAARVPGAGAKGPIVIALLLLAVAVPIALRLRVAVAALAALSVASTISFNPLVRGGSEYLTANPLSQRILELDRAGGGKTRWAVFGHVLLPDLFRAIGVRAINGLHYYPQQELWSRLGVLGLGAGYENVYNRYAHVTFELTDPGHGAGINLASTDWVVVKIHPDHAAFARLDLDYVLYVGPERGVLDGIERLRWVESIGEKHIFRVLR